MITAIKDCLRLGTFNKHWKNSIFAAHNANQQQDTNNVRCRVVLLVFIVLANVQPHKLDGFCITITNVYRFKVRRSLSCVVHTPIFKCGIQEYMTNIHPKV